MLTAAVPIKLSHDRSGSSRNRWTARILTAKCKKFVDDILNLEYVLGLLTSFQSNKT